LEVAPVPDEFRGGPRSSDTFFRIGEDWYRVIRDPGTGAVYGVEPCGEPARPRTYWVARAVDPAAPLSERIGIEISDPADAPAGYAVEGPHETYRTRRTMATKYWQAQLRRGCNVIDMDFPRRETADEAIEDARERLSSLSDRERAGCTASAVEWNWFDCDCMTTGRFVDIDDTL
jgi:hypothetical protein